MKLIDFSKIESSKEEKEINKLLPDITGLGDLRPKKKRSLQSLVNNSNTPISTDDVVKSLFIKFGNHRYLINNAYIFNGWESDFITVTESMYVYEIESKITKSDFVDDFNKKDKHLLLESRSPENKLNIPNKFYYAAPKGMLLSHEIPKYAGLIEVYRKGESIEADTVKEAPFLHKEDVFSNIKDALLQKLSWRYRDIMLKDIFYSC